MGLTDAQRRRYARGMILDRRDKKPTAALLDEIERFLSESGVSAATFGVYVLGDGKLVERLRAGGRIELDNAQRVLDAIEDWPAVKAQFLAANAERRAKPKAKQPAKRRKA